MQTQYRFFDDIARLANGAAGTLAGARSEVETLVKQRMESVLADMDVVPREEFEVVREMARTAREENDALKKTPRNARSKTQRKIRQRGLASDWVFPRLIFSLSPAPV